MVTDSEVVDISSANHTFAIKVDAIFVGGGGTVIATLEGDSAARTWVVSSGPFYLLGRFTSVTRTGTTATGLIGVVMPQRQ